MAALETVVAILSANLLSIILTVSLCIILYVWGVAPFRKSALVAVTGDLPGPQPLPFLGNSFDLLKHKGQILKQFQEYYHKFGRLYSMFFFGKNASIVVSDPNMIKEIMVKEFSFFHDRPSPIDVPKPLDSMMTRATGKTWQRIRNTLSPTFSTHKLKMMIPLMNTSCDVLMKKLDEVAKTGDSFNIHKFNQGLTMDTILKTAFGIQSDAQLNYDDPAFQAARRALGTSPLRRIVLTMVSLLPFSSALFKAFPKLLLGNFLDLLHLTEKIVDVKKTSREDQRKDMLDLMLDAATVKDENKKMSEDEVIAQSVIFLIAGYDTTNNTLSFACHSLATHPDVQDKLQQEIDSVWTDEDQMPSYDTVNQLPYLDMVLSETLRMYPPAFITNRQCTQECIIKGVHFRKDVIVLIDIYNLHHDPEFWPSPEQFDPDRFTMEAKQSRDPYTYLPFGHGPRKCIGMRFAQMELKLALVRMLKKYRFVVTADTKVPPPVVVRALLGCGEDMKLGIRHRH